MLYTAALFLHSWWRWVVLVFAITVLVRSVRGWRTDADWSSMDAKLARAFVGAVDIQMTVGLLMLFALSPITTLALHAMGQAMKDATLRFFTVEHPFMMIIAVATAHVSLVRAKKAKTGKASHRRMAVGVILFVLFVAIGIPWRGMPYARPLLRF